MHAYRDRRRRFMVFQRQPPLAAASGHTRLPSTFSLPPFCGIFWWDNVLNHPSNASNLRPHHCRFLLRHPVRSLLINPQLTTSIAQLSPICPAYLTFKSSWFLEEILIESHKNKYLQKIAPSSISLSHSFKSQYKT